MREKDIIYLQVFNTPNISELIIHDLWRCICFKSYIGGKIKQRGDFNSLV